MTSTEASPEPSVRVLWLRPTKPDNISVGRERIAEHLTEWGYTVDIQDASGMDAIRASWIGLSQAYDVIVGTVRMGLYVGSLLSTVTGLPFIADVTDPIEQINHLPSPLYRLLFEFEQSAIGRADEAMFVYNSSYRTAKQYGVDGQKVDNGVNYHQFNEPDPAVVETATEELDAAGLDDRPIAIYIGGLTPVYHIEAILDTARALDDIQFLFIGDGELSETVSAATATENVFYLGTYDYELMPGFLAVADVGLCLVDAEQPLKVLEYGAAGLPVVAVTGELEDRFSEDELWILDRPEALADAVSTLVANPDLAQQYGTNLNKRAKRTQWSRIADAYKHAIDRVIYD